jgi:hypothetical protein
VWFQARYLWVFRLSGWPRDIKPLSNPTMSPEKIEICGVPFQSLKISWNRLTSATVRSVDRGRSHATLPACFADDLLPKFPSLRRYNPPEYTDYSSQTEKIKGLLRRRHRKVSWIPYTSSSSRIPCQRNVYPEISPRPGAPLILSLD